MTDQDYAASVLLDLIQKIQLGELVVEKSMFENEVVKSTDSQGWQQYRVTGRKTVGLVVAPPPIA